MDVGEVSDDVGKHTDINLAQEKTKLGTKMKWGHRWHVHHRHRPHLHHRHSPHLHHRHHRHHFHHRHRPHLHHRHRPHIHVPHIHTAEMIRAAAKALKDARDLAAKKAKDAADWAVKQAKDAKDLALKKAREAAKLLKDAKDFAAKKLKDARDWAAARLKQLKDAAARAAKAVKDAAAKAARDLARAAAALAKKVALGLLKAACAALQFTLDKIIAGSVGAIGKLGVAAVMVGGKLVAKGLQVLGGAMENLFSIQRMYYKGSLKQAARGNFGSMQIKLTIMGKKIEINMSFDISNLLASIKREAVKMVSRITSLIK